MTSSVRLGRIAGVEVGFNWSWLIVLALLVWLLEAGVFPARSPGLDEGSDLAMAAAAAVAFVACLVLHELGHALQARREGVDGRHNLWLLGGVARYDDAFPSPGAELRIALAGPAVSAALGVGFVLAAALLALPAAVDGVVAWLGYINLVLARLQPSARGSARRRADRARRPVARSRRLRPGRHAPRPAWLASSVVCSARSVSPS